MGPDAARERLVDDWLAAHEGGEHAVMLAHRRRDVRISTSGHESACVRAAALDPISW